MVQEKNINVANTINYASQHGKAIVDGDQSKPHIHGPNCNHDHGEKKIELGIKKPSGLKCVSCQQPIVGKPFASVGEPLCKQCFIKIHTPVINRNKIGRNNLCPCGSNKKFKNCCLKKENQADSEKAIAEYNKKKGIKELFDELAENTKTPLINNEKIQLVDNEKKQLINNEKVQLIDNEKKQLVDNEKKVVGFESKEPPENSAK